MEKCPTMPAVRMARVFRSFVLLAGLSLLVFLGLMVTGNQKHFRTDISHVGSAPRPISWHLQGNPEQVNAVFIPNRKKDRPKDKAGVKSGNITRMDETSKRRFDYAKMRFELLKKKRLETLTRMQEADRKRSTVIKNGGKGVANEAAERVKVRRVLANKVKPINDVPDELPKNGGKGVANEAAERVKVRGVLANKVKPINDVPDELPKNGGKGVTNEAAERVKVRGVLANKVKPMNDVPDELPKDDTNVAKKAATMKGLPKIHLSEKRTKYAPPQNPIFIVILARMRTGSTLLGEIFNQNPSLFYIYEPLISLDPALRSGEVAVSEHRDVSSKLLLDYSQCRYPTNLTENWMKWTGSIGHSLQLQMQCQRRGPKGKRNCSALTPDDLTRTCRASNQRLCVKTIRSDLDYLKPLVDQGVNVKVIHLVRDPRGVANSRKLYYMMHRPKWLPRRKLNGTRPGNIKGRLDLIGLMGNYPDHMVHTIPRLCQWTRDSILAVKNKPAWLRKRYKLVRYEDFALDPLRVARDIYDFIDMPLPERVSQWVVSNTRSNIAASVKLFSTHKNSSETAMRWRTSMRPQQIRQVEGVCGDAMELLGYKKFVTSSQLSDFDVPLMGPLPMEDTL